MAVKFTVTPIIPRPMRLRKFQTAVDKALVLERRTIKALYNDVSRDFEGGVSYKEKGPFSDGRSRKVEVSTDDLRMVYLDRGTKERWALMSSDFRPMTTPRRLSSRRKSGHTIIVGKTAMQARGISARPGIKAREFSKEIAKVRARPFAERVQLAINEAAKALF